MPRLRLSIVPFSLGHFEKRNVSKNLMLLMAVIGKIAHSETENRHVLGFDTSFKQEYV